MELHSLLFPLRGDKPEGENEKEYLLPVRLSDIPPRGFSEICAPKQGEVAWVVVLQFLSIFFPPAFLSELMRALHVLSDQGLCAYFQHGGVVRDKSRKLVFFFDRPQRQIHLHAYGESKNDAWDLLDRATKAVRGVVASYVNLFFTAIPKEYEFVPTGSGNYAQVQNLQTLIQRVADSSLV